MRELNGFWLFVSSCLPGCGQMYQGYMKRGASLLVLFWVTVGVSSILQLSALGVLIAFPFIARFIDLDLPGGWAILRGGVVVLVGVWLVARTVAVSRSAAMTGVAALGFALIALTARSLDAQACAHLDQGSHFLWHIFLSSAAFLLMLTLVRLGYAGRFTPSPAA